MGPSNLALDCEAMVNVVSGFFLIYTTLAVVWLQSQVIQKQSSLLKRSDTNER
jgi:hypothetical protein